MQKNLPTTLMVAVLMALMDVPLAEGSLITQSYPFLK